MARRVKSVLVILCLVLLLGCDSSTTSSGGAGQEIGVVNAPQGSVTLECLKIQWEAQGDNVQIVLYIDNHKVSQFILTADNPQKYFHHAEGKAQAYGTIGFFAKSVWGSASLEAQNVTTVEGGCTVHHSGTIATW